MSEKLKVRSQNTEYRGQEAEVRIGSKAGVTSQNKSKISPNSQLRAPDCGCRNSQFAVDWLFPAISGILIVLSQPPVSLFPAAYLALVPLIYSLKINEERGNFIRGFVTGAAAYLGLIYWVVIAMNRYGGIDIFSSFLLMIALALYMAVYIGIFAASVPYLKKALSIPFFISAPITWALLEYLRGIVLDGFPWSLLAYSQYNFLPLIQIVSVTGTYFISFLIVAVNCIVYCVIKGVTGSEGDRGFKGASFAIYCAVILMFFVAALGYGFSRLQMKGETNLKTTIIQGNIPQNVKWDEAFKIKTVRTYVEKTLEAGPGAALVIWPETALPFVFDKETNISGFIAELPRIVHTNLLFGTVSKDRGGNYYNTAYIYGNDGKPAGEYNKVHLVPFGEYTPLVKYFPFLAKFTAAGGDFNPGKSHAPIATSTGNIGILICYEGIFPDITNDTVRRGAEVLVNITNDAWFGRTSAPYQHLAFYIFRAIETDRYVLRAANTGISAVIDPRGRITGRTGLFEEAALKGSFSLRNGRTPYVLYGDSFILAIFLFLALVCVVKGLRKRTKT